MYDRYYHGLITGVLASIIQAVVSLSAYWLKLSTLRFQDFSGVFLYGQRPIGLFASVFAEFAVWIFSGLMGIVLSLLIPAATSTNYLLKTWFFGITVWFFSFAITILLQVKGLSHIDLSSAIVNFVGASVWGISFGLISRSLAKRVNV